MQQYHPLMSDTRTLSLGAIKVQHLAQGHWHMGSRNKPLRLVHDTTVLPPERQPSHHMLDDFAHNNVPLVRGARLSLNPP